MPELRWGPLRRRWVIVAPERGKRPSDFRVQAPPAASSPRDCPFCPGNEHLTPPEIARISGPDGNWRVRVVPNKFPALSDGSRLELARQGIFRRASGLGAHEVVIDSPDHVRDLDELSLEQVRLVVDMYIERLVALSSDPRFRYVQLFKNHGREGGASLSHPHSQIVATPVLPQEAEARLSATRDFHSVHGGCLVCELAREELKAGDRVVEAGDFLVLSPYDARFPFELLILPREHGHDFTQLSRRDAFAKALKGALTRLRTLLGDVPYNFVLHTAPRGTDWPGIEDWYHWHLEIIPRLTKLAGFEWGTGMFINPMPPEAAAEHLRAAL